MSSAQISAIIRGKDCDYLVGIVTTHGDLSCACLELPFRLAETLGLKGVEIHDVAWRDAFGAALDAYGIEHN